MRVVYLSATSAMGPASRYRIFQFQPYFEAAGIELDILPALGDDWLQAEYLDASKRQLKRIKAAAMGAARRLSQLALLGKADLVIIERELFPKLPGSIEHFLLKRCAPYGIEFDDAIYLSKGRADKYPKLLRNASFVITGNEHLASWARQHQDRVHVIPTCVPVQDYTAKQDYALGTLPEIGWVGLTSNLPYVAQISPLIREPLEKFGARIHILSGQPGDLQMPSLFTPWSLQKEQEIIQGFDIGVMPLPTNGFTRGKCGLKILQYMAAGIPVVASAVGVNQTIIQDGINGILIHDSSEWAPAIERLLEDKALRQALGSAGRETAKSLYSTETWGPKLVRLYQELAA